ncbi:hypothetical protein BDV97DRAFT_371527 [Delphinella strobiligena]|nr:hypothetical protein BDV97DRAFT_371527 [Delphinella strobiligena]
MLCSHVSLNKFYVTQFCIPSHSQASQDISHNMPYLTNYANTEQVVMPSRIPVRVALPESETRPASCRSNISTHGSRIPRAIQKVKAFVKSSVKKLPGYTRATKSSAGKAATSSSVSVARAVPEKKTPSQPKVKAVLKAPLTKAGKVLDKVQAKLEPMRFGREAIAKTKKPKASSLRRPRSWDIAEWDSNLEHEVAQPSSQSSGTREENADSSLSTIAALEAQFSELLATVRAPAPPTPEVITQRSLSFIRDHFATGSQVDCIDAPSSTSAASYQQFPVYLHGTKFDRTQDGYRKEWQCQVRLRPLIQLSEAPQPLVVRPRTRARQSAAGPSRPRVTSTGSCDSALFDAMGDSDLLE